MRFGRPKVPEVSASDVIAANGSTYLLDVREPGEWNAGHAPGAVHIPMGSLGERQGELPTDRRIVVVCRSGNRSAHVTAALLGAGYDAVNLAGGMQAWASGGGEVRTPQGKPGRVA